MKYSIMAEETLETPAKRDGLHSDLLTRIGGRKTWGEVVLSKGVNGENHATEVVNIRFENRADMEDLFAFLKDEMERIPVLVGTVSKHDCPHDENSPRPCVIAEKFRKK